MSKARKAKPEVVRQAGAQLRLNLNTTSFRTGHAATEREPAKEGSAECRIVSVGKRRDGGTRYWCLEHRADATAKYGRRAQHCRYAHVLPLHLQDVLKLNVDDYPGGVALWGAVPPVYDTTRRPLDRGIHVHARRTANGAKDIDATYRQVRLTGEKLISPSAEVTISELDAIYYMVTSVFGFDMKYVECTYCGYPHLDKDWFSVHAHRRHLCAGCGKHFRDTDVAVGNPICAMRTAVLSKVPKTKPAKRKLSIRQQDYPGGIQIWGSNPAIIWTGKRSEEEGIHVHGFMDDHSDPLIDDTFAAVTIDDVELDARMVRTLMAQSALPHIGGRVISLNCPDCESPHFSVGEQSFTPGATHSCQRCKNDFSARGRLRNVIGNPLVATLHELGTLAPRAPQRHEIGLLPETI